MDLYSLLGLNRSASAGDIERAYRRLARRYHPGVNPGDRVAEDLYRQIQDAYDVLVDVNLRREYDRGGGTPVAGSAASEARMAFEGFDFSAIAEGPGAATFSELFADVFQEAAREAATPSRGIDIELETRVSFLDAARGADTPISVNRQDRCPTCLGDGRVARTPIACSACRGLGERRWARGHMVFAKACQACEGQGRVASEPCRTCAGVGTAPRTDVVTLTLPAGSEPGVRLVVPGRGHAGARGGPAGNLYVKVDVADHPFFRREGADLLLTLPVAVHEAALGARIDVPLLDGKATLRVPPGTQTGTRLRLRGRGIATGGAAESNRAGDLVVEVRVVLPAVMEERSKALLREFAELNRDDVRRGLFDRT